MWLWMALACLSLGTHAAIRVHRPAAPTDGTPRAPTRHEQRLAQLRTVEALLVRTAAQQHYGKSRQLC